MAFIGRLFGSGGSKTGNNPTRSVPAAPKESAPEQLSKTIDTLDRREKVLEKRIQEEEAKAKAFLAKKNQKAAMGCLKRKKLLEQQLEKTGGYKMNLETLEMYSQDAAVSKEVIEVNKRAAADLKAKSTNIEEVEKLKDEVTDLIDTQNEVSELLSESLVPGMADDDELMDELNNLQEEVDDEAFLSVPSQLDVNIPSGPIQGKAQPAAPSKQQTDEDAYLQELEAELAGS